MDADLTRPHEVHLVPEVLLAEHDLAGEHCLFLDEVREPLQPLAGNVLEQGRAPEGENDLHHGKQSSSLRACRRARTKGEPGVPHYTCASGLERAKRGNAPTRVWGDSPAKSALFAAMGTNPRCFGRLE